MYRFEDIVTYRQYKYFSSSPNTIHVLNILTGMKKDAPKGYLAVEKPLLKSSYLFYAYHYYISFYQNLFAVTAC